MSVADLTYDPETDTVFVLDIAEMLFCFGLHDDAVGRWVTPAPGDGGDDEG